MRVKIIFILLLVSLILISSIVTRGNTNGNNIDSDTKPINLYLSNENDEFWNTKLLKIETPNSTLDSSEDVPKISTRFIFQIIGNWSIWPMGNIIIDGQFGFEFWVEASLSLNVEFVVKLYIYNGTMNFISTVQSESIYVYGIQKIEANTEIEYMQVNGRLGVEVLARANYEGCKLLYNSIEHDSHITIECDPFDISISEPEINTDLEIAKIQMKIHDAFMHLEDCDFQLSIFGPVEGKAISNYTTEKEYHYSNVIWNWDYKKDYAIDGNYSISVTVIDYNGNFRKYSTKYFFDFPHLQIPDLWINEISFSSNEVTEGDLLNISVTVSNIGYTDVKSARVEFYDDSDLFKILNVTTIEVNGYKNISVTWLAIDAGKHVIKVKIDPKNEITEVDESNNEISQVIRISPRINNPPIINDILAEPSKVNLGGSSKITVDAYDEDNDSLIYSYKISSGVIEGKGNFVTWIAPDIEGIYKIKVTVTDSFNDEDYGEISITVEKLNFPPIIILKSVTPDRIKNDGNSKALFTVEIDDENGLIDIITVKIDLTAIGGSKNQRMYDDGSHGDLESQDGIYSYEIIISAETSEGKKELTIIVLDYSNCEVSDTITLKIEKASVKTENGLPSFEGTLLVMIMIIFIFLNKRKRNKSSNLN